MQHPRRPHRARRVAGLATTLLCLCLGGRAAADEYQTYRGVARAPEAGPVLYREVHLLHLRDGNTLERLVLYTCDDGTPFARKLITYGAWPFAPDLRFEDERSGAFHAIESMGAMRRAAFRDRRGAKDGSAAVPADANLVADAGFDEFIHRRWDALIGRTPVPFDILLPSDGSILHLKARHLRHALLDGTDVEVFRVTLSGILGLIAPNIDVYYGTQDHVLRRYDGITNIPNARGHRVFAVIDFPGGPPAAIDALAWNEALLQPLTRVCAP